MKWVKSYQSYKESLIINLSVQVVTDLMESFNLWHDDILNSIGAKEVDIYDILKIPKEQF